MCRVNELIDYNALKYITEKLLHQGADLGLDKPVVFGNNKSFSSLAEVVEDPNLQSFVNKDVWALLSNHDVEEEEEVQAADEPARKHFHFCVQYLEMIFLHFFYKIYCTCLAKKSILLVIWKIHFVHVEIPIHHSTERLLFGDSERIMSSCTWGSLRNLNKGPAIEI